VATLTPDAETDFAAELAARLPASIFLSGPSQNTYVGNEVPSSQIAMAAVFVKHFSQAVDGHNDGPLRRFLLQVTVRTTRFGYAAGDVLARAIYDAMDRTGPFTQSGTKYLDSVGANGLPDYIGPGELDSEYLVVSFEMWHEG
jgi:hypothetical protein